jgi:hypothetical protein
MKIETKFNVGDIVYYLVGRRKIVKAKIVKIGITTYNDDKCNEVSIIYELEGNGKFKQDEIFKDFEDFKNTFQLKFEELNNTKLKEYLNNYKTNNEN